MLAVAVHGGGFSPGAGDADDPASGVELGPDGSDAPLLEVADGDIEVVHPLTASSKAAPASAPANRWVALPR